MQVITQHNILNPDKKTVLPTFAKHSSEILDTLLIAKGFEVAFYKNSEFMPEPFDIEEGDIINVVFIPEGGKGGGKSVISLVAMIGLAVFAPELAANFIGFANIEVTAMGFYAIQAGVMIAGGLLINAVLGANTSTASLSTDLSTSSTYSWDTSYNKFTQGIPVPIVFGTHKITPPMISKYIESVDDTQYFNALYALNDGEIISVGDIKINDEDIANFDNVVVQMRNGTNYQTLINTFDNTRSDRPVAKKLSTDYVTATTYDNDVVGISATLCFTRGLYHVNDSGNLDNYSVKVVLEYSSDGTTWIRFGGDTTVTGLWYLHTWGSETYDVYDSYDGTKIDEVYDLPADVTRYAGSSKYEEWWYAPTYTNPYTTITSSESSTFRKTFSLNNLPAAQYQIRTKFYEAPLNSSRYASDCYLEYITEEIGDDFIYPKTALIAIRALATDQLSGSSPKITCTVTANSNNPSLACQKILKDCGEDESSLLDSFATWESYCNTKQLYFNGVFDSSQSVRKVLDVIGVIGRGSVQQFGTNFGVIIDKEEIIPTQGFTIGMGNILKDSMEVSYLSLTDRANVIECTYYDAENDYEPTVIQKSLTGYDNVSEDNKVSLSLPGCTSKAQAVRQCVYQLKCNRLLTETVKLKVDKDGLWSKYGDIVAVSHPLVVDGKSGRIVSYSSTQVTLDEEVTLQSGKTYYLQLRDSANNIAYYQVLNTENTTSAVTLINAISTEYEKYDNYQFGEYEKVNKLYRIVNITTSGDATRTLSLLEYNESIYDDTDDDFSVINVGTQTLTNLNATDYIRYAKDGSIETVMQLSWSGTSLYYTVKYKKTSDVVYTSTRVYKNNLDLIAEDVSYDVIVTDANSNTLSTTYTVQGKTTPPEPVTDLTSQELQDEFKVTWNYAFYPIDFKQFEIYVDGILFSAKKDLTCLVPIKAARQFIKVYAVDTTGHYSEQAILAVTPSFLESIEAINALYQNKQQSLYWNKIENSKSPILYEIRKGETWDYAQVIGTTAETTFKAATNGTYHVRPSYTTKYGLTIYSETSAIVVVDGNILPGNIIANFNEETWDGIKTNTMIYEGFLTLESNVEFDAIPDFDALTNFNFPNLTVTGIGYYESTNIVNIGTPKICTISADYSVEAENLADDFDAIPDFDTLTNFNGYTSSDFLVNVQIAISQDGEIYGEWKPFTNGDYLGQAFKMRLALISINSFVRPIVKAFGFQIDMPDRFEQGTATTPANIVFSTPFEIEKPYTQITLSNAEQGDGIQITDETNAGFSVNVLNNGMNVSRTFSFYTSGY